MYARQGRVSRVQLRRQRWRRSRNMASEWQAVLSNGKVEDHQADDCVDGSSRYSCCEGSACECLDLAGSSVAAARDSDSDVSTSASSGECRSALPDVNDEGVLHEDEAACAAVCGDPRDNARISAENVYLLSGFLELSKLRSTDTKTMLMLLRTISFLRCCNYDAQDIIVVLAHASVYFSEAAAACEGRFERVPGEAGYIIALLTYLAHCHVLDETCPLRFWHQRLFGGYCTLPLLDKALLRLMALRGYRLRIGDDDLTLRCDQLRACLGAQ